MKHAHLPFHYSITPILHYSSCFYANIPPSQTKHAPVVNEAASDTR